MNRRICLLILLLIRASAWSQDYNVQNIPDSLKKNADAVTRFEELHVIIKAVDKVIVKRKYAITVLNQKGDMYAQYVNSYSSLEDLDDISGTLYDASGKKLKSVKKRDIIDVVGTDGFSLMLDARIKAHDFHYRQYPYTVEYEDEQISTGSYFLPAWKPVPAPDYSVEQSRYLVETPAGYKLRYRETNTAPVKITDQPAAVYTWELKQFSPMRREVFQPPFSSLAPSVYIGADNFSLGGKAGNMSTWLEFGKFQSVLNKDRDILPENIKKKVHELTDNIAGRDEKVRILYQFMQDNTRYVSVQLGIGGWQPFDAKYVAANKYGDCKALSNFMISLLKEAGIKANYVIIDAGRGGGRQLKEDFPAPLFNHVIACVPGNQDTLWLECTSQTVSAGFMGSFTGDRQALLVDDDGGHVVHTPVYKAEDNMQVRNIRAKLDEEGNMSAEINTHFTGIQQEQPHFLMHNNTDEERKKYLNSHFALATYSVDKYDYKQTKGKLPAIDEYLRISAAGYANTSGKRLFITPNVLDKSSVKLFPDANRMYPIVISNAYKDIDSIYIDVPTGYSAEAMPRNVSIETKFGKYSISYQLSGQQIQVVRCETVNKIEAPPDAYPELVKYCDAIYKADHARMVLVKKEAP